MKQQEDIAGTPGQTPAASAPRKYRSGWGLSVSLALVFFLAGVAVWRSLVPIEADRRHLQTQKAGVSLVAAVGGKLRGQLNASLRQTERLGRADTSRAEFERDAKLFLRDFPGVLAIRYSRADATYDVARSDADATALFRALDIVSFDPKPSRIPSYSQALSTAATIAGRTVYFETFSHLVDGQPITMTTALDAQSWLGEPLAAEINYVAGVFDGDHAVLDPSHIAANRTDAEHFPIEGAGRPWSLVVAPGAVVIAAGATYLPTLVLVAPALLALIVGIAAQLAMLARERKVLVMSAAHRLAEQDERRRDAEMARDVAHRDLGAILESITDGFIILDRDFRYVYVNGLAASLASEAATDIIGRPMWYVFPDFATTGGAELLRDAMRERKSISFERQRPDGRYFAVRAYPHRDGLALYFHDISAQRKVADRLRKSETLLKLAQSIASIGSFTYNVGTQDEHWSDQMFALLDLGSDEDRRGRRFMHFVEADDRVRLAETEAQLGAEISEKEVRLHVTSARGERRAVITRMRLERDGEGHSSVVVGTVQDITNLETAEAARASALAQSRQQSAKFRALNRAMLLISAKLGHPDLHQVLVEELRDTVRAHIGVLQFDSDAQPVISLSDKYTDWPQAANVMSSLHALAQNGRANKPIRLSQHELSGHPVWSALEVLPADHAPLRGVLSIPLYDRRGERLGFLQACDRQESEFTADDEAVAIQFAQIASVAIGWARLIDDLRKTQTDLSHQLEEVDRSRRLLTEAERVAKLGSWEIEPPLSHPLRIKLSEEAARIVERETAVTFEELAANAPSDDAEMLRQRVADLVAGHSQMLDAEFRLRTSVGQKRLHVKAQMKRDRGNLAHVIGSLQDVTQQRLDAEQDRLNAIAFAGIAAGIPLEDSLANVIAMYESRFPDGICSILLYDPQKGLRTGSASGLPDAYNAAINGLAAGAKMGSCGTAIFRRERVIVTDTQTDPLWADFAPLAAQHGLAACWSTPIFDGARNVVGTFAVYYRQTRAPTREELECVDRATSVAAVAISAQRSRQQIEDREQRFRSLFTYVPDAVFGLDMDGNIVDCNQAAVEMTGFTRERLVHSPMSVTVVSELHEQLASHIALAASGAPQEIELERVRPDGSRYTTVSTKTPIVVDGALVGIFAIVRDVTLERVNRIALEEALRTVKGHNRELEEFAFVASHDLQEPLRKVRAFGDRLRMHLDSRADSESLDYIERMRAAAERMQRLIDDLLAYSRVAKRGHALRRIELNDVLAGVLTDLETSIEQKNAQIIHSPLPGIDGDETQMRQLLQNLISNALKFVREDRPPRITIRGEVFRPDSGFDRRPWVRLVIADNGIGFDNKYAERIFGAFQRLHGQREYSGSGIGLAIVRRIAERHGGHIRAHGAPGEGATFVIEMPQQGHDVEAKNAVEEAAEVSAP
ncbi:MAG TPA: PAS domain S-box protein [Rudaea sp.]|jgi:PAS domain S-box-containing protein|nr:PAS domain S-box protein [Rudaea sp.]